MRASEYETLSLTGSGTPVLWPFRDIWEIVRPVWVRNPAEALVYSVGGLCVVRADSARWPSSRGSLRRRAEVSNKDASKVTEMIWSARLVNEIEATKALMTALANGVAFSRETGIAIRFRAQIGSVMSAI